ncbi:hypothetical protein SprV_0702371300 [Sparganum proliferum]
MGLLDHMRIHESGIGINLDTPSTSCTSTMPSSTHNPPPSTQTTISSTKRSTSCTPTMPSSTNTPSSSTSTISSYTIATISETDNDATDFFYPHCPPTFTSHIGLTGHLLVHRTETGEPVPGVPTYNRRIRTTTARPPTA